MKKKTTLIFAILFSLYSLAGSRTITNTITVDNNGNGTTVTISDDEVLIDGKSVEDYVDEQINGAKDEVVQDTTLYRTKNVDAYNKWYNKNRVKILESRVARRNQIIKNVVKFTIYILLGLLWIYIAKLTIRYIKISREYRALKKHKFPWEQPIKSQEKKSIPQENKGVPAVEEIKSPIKNK